MMPVILESPYRADGDRSVDDNIDYACKCMCDSLARGEAPFASHLLYTYDGILDDDIENEREIGIMAGYTWWLPGVMKIVFYTDHGWSTGMAFAKARADLMHVQTEERQLYNHPTD